jgi:hypothetical protein
MGVLEWLWRAFRLVREAYDLLPQRVKDWWWWIAGWVGVEAWALWASIPVLPPHAVVLVSIFSLAGVTIFMQGVVAVYSRLYLLALIRDGERLLESGRTIRDAVHAARGNLPILTGRLRDLEDWRTAMHARMLTDPRVRQFEALLRNKDPQRDRITVPLIGLEQALAHLRSRL